MVLFKLRGLLHRLEVCDPSQFTHRRREESILRRGIDSTSLGRPMFLTERKDFLQRGSDLMQELAPSLRSC